MSFVDFEDEVCLKYLPAYDYKYGDQINSLSPVLYYTVNFPDGLYFYPILLEYLNKDIKSFKIAQYGHKQSGKYYVHAKYITDVLDAIIELQKKNDMFISESSLSSVLEETKKAGYLTEYDKKIKTAVPVKDYLYNVTSKRDFNGALKLISFYEEQKEESDYLNLILEMNLWENKQDEVINNIAMKYFSDKDTITSMWLFSKKQENILAIAVKSKPTKLKLSGGFYMDAVINIGKFMKECESLEDVEFYSYYNDSRCLDIYTIQPIIEALAFNIHIKSANFITASISENVVLLIAKALVGNKVIKKISFNKDWLSNEAIKTISQMLPEIF